MNSIRPFFVLLALVSVDQISVALHAESFVAPFSGDLDIQPGTNTSNPTTLDFEPPFPPSLVSVSFWQGTPVPGNGRISNQYASQGVLMDGVALVDAGVGHAASGRYMLSGISPSSTVDYGAPLTFDFVNPTDGRTPALVDVFAITTDRWGGSGNVVTVTGYDLGGLPVGSVSQVDTASMMTLRLQGVGSFHRVVVQATLYSPGSGGVGFDLLTFGPSVSTPPTAVLPQFCFGGGWYSALYFTNTSSSAVSIPVSFVGDDGNPMIVPSAGGSTITLNLAPRGTAVFEAPNVGPLTQGYASVSLSDGIVGYGVFRSTVPGRSDQEAVVPLSGTSSTSSTLIWDDTAFTTTAAIINPSSVPNWVMIVVRDSRGAIIGNSSIPLV